MLIGAGQFTYRGEPGASPSPVALLKIAADRAAADAGIGAAGLAAIDALAVAGFTVDAPGGRRVVPHSSNPPLSLARQLGAAPGWSVYSHMGGNTPQQLVNVIAERIARGETDMALAVGCEFLGSAMKRLTKGLGFDDWNEDEDLPAPERIGDPRPGVTPYEARHGLNRPINCYPLFENALRARDGRSIADHQARLGRLFAPFTKVAAENPEAWFPVERSAEELITVSERNRMVGFPYPKLLNAIMEVDQSAGVILASVAKARELGVPEDRWVYLHGCADAADLWYPLDRQDFHSSPAMRLTGQRALGMAGARLSDIRFIDLYSCFPVAVEIGAEELGLALDDPRGLTVTGGLPYAGGPGNNYAMHSIAVMAAKLRAAPGALGVEIEVDPRVGEIPTPAALSLEARGPWLRKSFGGTWAEIEGDLDYDAWRREITASLAARGGTAVFSHYVATNAVVSQLLGDPKVLAFRPDHASITVLATDGETVSLVELGREATTGVL